MRLYLKVALLAVLLCSSCTDKKQTLESRLDMIETIISSDPHKARNELENIDRSDIKTKRGKARHSLLYSMALDKCGIDICSDSIISPAVENIPRFNIHDRTRCLYYYARIFENRKEYENSMKWLVRAEDSGRDLKDSDIPALIYAAKGRIYHKSLAYSKAADNYRKAAFHNYSNNLHHRFISNRLKEADCLLMDNDPIKADVILSEIEREHSNLLSPGLMKIYYQLKIRLSEELYPDDTYRILEEYLDYVSEEAQIDWIMTARLYIKAGNRAEASEALEKQLAHNGESAAYYYLLGEVYGLLNENTKAIDAYKMFIDKSGIIGNNILNQDTKFIEEREMLRSMHEQEKMQRIILSLLIGIILLVLSLTVAIIVSISRQLKIKTLERDNLARQLDGLMQEREELAEIERENREGREIIRERLRIIDQFVMSDAFNDGVFEDKASRTLKKILSDRSEFVRQNRLIFNQSSGSFIAFLKARGLTDIEIDHCCLYAIGMNGKMVTAFTNIKRHYHIGSDVRKKLGLSGHDTNISIYIRKLYKELESHRPEA